MQRKVPELVQILLSQMLIIWDTWCHIWKFKIGLSCCWGFYGR